MQTAYDLIWMAAERTPNAFALVDDQTQRNVSYRALIAETDRIAAGLWARGIRPGDPVAVALPNRIEHPLALIALMRIGAVPVLLNIRLDPQQLSRLVAEAGCAAAIVSNDPALAAALAAESAQRPVLTMDAGPAGHSSFAACHGDPATLPGRYKPQPDDTAFIFYTSGTTGEPKAATIPHRASEHRITWLAPSTGLCAGPQLRALGIAPLFHAIGFFGVFLSTLALNGSYHTVPAFDAAQTIDMIERHQINFLFAVPTLFQALLNAPNYQPERLRSLEHVIYGGAPIPPALLNRIDAEWPATVRHAYGTTELMTALYQPDPVGQPRTLRACYGTRIRVVRVGGGPDDRAGPGVAGELITDAATDSMFTGYLGKPEATRQKLRDGWYFTGDLAIQHDNGDVDLVGRVDDMIRSGGESIYPEEIEAVLAGHRGVAESCVLGVPHELWGEMAVACVVPRKPGLSAQDLDSHCRSSVLANFKRPRAYVFRDALPRNASNKILRRVLREQLLTQTGAHHQLAWPDLAHQRGEP